MKTTQEVLISLAEEIRNMHPKANKDGIAAHIAMKAQECTSPGDGWEPTDDKERRWILGRPNFACAGIAQKLRVKGYEIEPKAEDEQSVVIDWMLNLYAKHGADWRAKAENFLKRPQPPVNGGGG